MLDRLKQFTLFKELTDSQIERLREIFMNKKIKAGDIFIHEGKVEQRFYIITEGEIEIIKKNGDRYYPLCKIK